MTQKRRTVMLKRALGIAVMLLASFSAFAAEDDPLGYALLIQQSPADGGTVTPGAGVHKVSIGQSVELSADPRPGYRFLYWLGDVSATSSPVTSVSLDSPKMVIAVFERESFDEDLLGAGPIAGRGSRGGGGGLRNSPYPMTSPAAARIGMYIGDVNIVYSFENVNNNTEETPIYKDKVPVPGDETVNDNPIPEPATVILLGLGTAAFLRKRQ